ncbi:S9 family peptidase [Acidianus sp. RZ1]|uniref:S9 family peptidase n=1 Tax=Acidianus sp. RZ1 TaxID=1540082 RepID=UPI001490C160|nr:S9 family peptidase [Acidianus sp. RZ1]NON63243.1 S9 family peptidase [Acidianus sp. RZ1]
MTPEDAYSIRVISDVKLNENGLMYVETEIRNHDYYSMLFSNDKKVISGHISLPSYYNGYLYYVKGKKEKHLIRKKEYGIEEDLLSLRSISNYTFHRKGILILGEEKINSKTPFSTTKRKYRFDSRGLLRSRQSLFIFDGELRKLVSGDFDVTDVSTNGERVVISATIDDDDFGLANVYEVNVDTGEIHKISEGKGTVEAVAVNKKGEVAFLGQREGLSPWASNRIFFPEKGKSVICGKTCGNFVLTDIFDGTKIRIIYDDVVYTLGQEGGETHLYKVLDDAEKITSGQISVRGFDYYNGKLAYFYSTPTKPSILKFEDKEVDPNQGIKSITPVKVNHHIEGWAMISSNNSPTILFIHGGPHMAYGYAYFIEFQFFASNGFNVIYCNPRGSKGYGEEFAKGCVGDWGGKDMQDILDFTRKIIEDFKLNGKIGITGGSYGGFMTNWIITRTDLFSAAISERSISNLVSMCGTSDIGFWFNAIEAGIEDPWNKEGMEKLMNLSPIYHVSNVKTPLMLIHGENDYRCPIEQAEQYFLALRSKGVEAELVRYPGESHEHARKGKPDFMVDRLRRKLEWFSLHLYSKK